MATYHTEDVNAVLELVSQPHDGVQAEMAAHADEEGFPIIGRDAGSVLTVAARMVSATRVFELGSGFGYSATWFLDALPPEGEIVLTELDADELDLGREFLGQRGDDDRAVFEHGDALEIVEAYDGPFDVVLIDHDKARYPKGFEAVREKMAPGGIVIADNMLHGPASAEEVRAGLEGRSANESVAGIAEYLELVRDAAEFDTSLLPVGSGLALSVRRH